ncbi:hypothetical protein TVAG_281150 [Trichomonas vaginalis G3]|uniref:Uncharacterized protein n=1 Tax=Trichomonas vaginalis (strain ATCC PRA-98 / G3) TaxID=412133 RepID=A2DRN5_TRIV3|nr:hypothetical protein TVAGG3_0696440 [Trichomonas vaginalis G3]EAY16998.1 hypothetical protein TVAG_281150 [Trichomonas vaginalis G3]KAI5508949.1 hypothetical protein TVAGG3_0696440 [Trichomonas vaginalis G3]|eukprot:XP_001329221.1 hypothetical protein [Trichomonas vaginalis G3]
MFLENDTSINFRFFLKSLGKSIHNDKKNPFHIEGLYDNIKYKALVHPLDISSRDIKTLYDFVIILCEQNKKDINYIKEIKLPKEINVIYLYRMNTGFYKIISHSKENINIKIIPECLIISAEYISTFIIEELVLWNHQLHINNELSNNQFYESWNDLIH